MSYRFRSWVSLVGVAVIVSACASAGTATSGPTGAAAPTQAAIASQGAAPTTAGATQPAGPAGAGTSSGKACDLLTGDEVGAATSQTGVTAQPLASDNTEGASGCGYVAGASASIAIVLILDPANTNTDPAGYLQLPGSADVPVTGAKAVFVPAAGNVTFVIKGSNVVTIQVLAPAPGEDYQKTEAKLVQKIADRMP
ncbi:MAG TPA: hypothetical protein VIM30_02380 [Candidatus Limnocylindrales bacterium]